MNGPLLKQALSIALAVPTLAELEQLRDEQTRDPGCVPGRHRPLPRRLAQRLQQIQRAGEVERECQRCHSQSIQLCHWHQDDYPAGLLDLAAPPPVLYLRGQGPWPPPTRALTVVGARRSTVTGRCFARRLGSEVARRKATVISGLARGIDQSAHEGAVENHGHCYAVLACGVNQIYPRSASRLAERIFESGRIVSEMPLGTAPLKPHFPRRNRILAAWATATIVVEADLRSGSLITAHRALELGREVLAVPGSIDSLTSRGTNRLIRDGAHPLLEVEDLDLLIPSMSESSSRSPDPLNDLTVPRSVDTLSELWQRPSEEVLERLLDYELEGKVENLGGGLFVVRP